MPSRHAVQAAGGQFFAGSGEGQGRSFGAVVRIGRRNPASNQEVGLPGCAAQDSVRVLEAQVLLPPYVAGGLPLTHGRAPPDSLTITSPPLDDRDETPKGFYLRRVEDALWLRAYWSSADHIWSPECVLVFSKGIAT